MSQHVVRYNEIRLAICSKHGIRELSSKEILYDLDTFCSCTFRSAARRLHADATNSTRFDELKQVPVVCSYLHDHRPVVQLEPVYDCRDILFGVLNPTRRVGTEIGVILFED